METATDFELDAASATGYDTADRFFATRYLQGGRVGFGIDLSLDQVASYLRRPDPNIVAEGNRKIRLNHAEAFARYIRNNVGWVAPALLLRAPEGVLSFEEKAKVGGMEFGLLSVPRLARTELHIIDGQHRILGIHIAAENIAHELDDTRGLLARARASGQDGAVIESLMVKLRKLEAQRDRMAKERISLDVIIIDDPQAYRQVFVDIADNALGITKAVRARFDATKVVNRCLSDVLDHTLLDGLVDMDHDRITGANKNLMGAVHVTDIIRIVEVGLAGRVSARMEAELRESTLVKQTKEFLDTLLAAFPQLGKVADGSMSAQMLREESLLGSVIMLRVLAGVYHELVQADGVQSGEVAAFLAKIAPLMKAPVSADSPWIDTGVFVEGASAPTARRQDLEQLKNAIVGWYHQPPTWLSV
jgi:hypothetical protein